MNRLRVVRKAKNMSVYQLAEKMDVAPATISRIERGLSDPSLQLARKLYQFFKDDGLLPHDFLQTPEQASAASSSVAS